MDCLKKLNAHYKTYTTDISLLYAVWYAVCEQYRLVDHTIM